MGSEALCRVQQGKQAAEGKALLETNEIIFRSPGFRLKIPLASIRESKAAGGELRLKTAEGLTVFAFEDETAEKWLKKIQNPKARIEKLGVKEGARVTLFGEFDAELTKELKAQKAEIVAGKISGETEWIFLAAETGKELSRVGKIAKSMKGVASLWVVYPKGREEITENEVIGAGRKAGLKDVKVVGFSATHTALKFVVPVEKR